MTLIDKIVHYIFLLLIWTVFKLVYSNSKVEKNVTLFCIFSFLVLLTAINRCIDTVVQFCSDNWYSDNVIQVHSCTMMKYYVDDSLTSKTFLNYLRKLCESYKRTNIPGGWYFPCPSLYLSLAGDNTHLSCSIMRVGDKIIHHKFWR